MLPFHFNPNPGNFLVLSNSPIEISEEVTFSVYSNVNFEMLHDTFLFDFSLLYPQFKGIWNTLFMKCQ